MPKTLTDDQAEIVKAVWELYMEDNGEPYDIVADKIGFDEDRTSEEDEDYDEEKDPIAQRVKETYAALTAE